MAFKLRFGPPVPAFDLQILAAEEMRLCGAIRKSIRVSDALPLKLFWQTESSAVEPDSLTHSSPLLVDCDKTLQKGTRQLPTHHLHPLKSDSHVHPGCPTTLPIRFTSPASEAHPLFLQSGSARSLKSHFSTPQQPPLTPFKYTLQHRTRQQQHPKRRSRVETPSRTSSNTHQSTPRPETINGDRRLQGRRQSR